MNRALSDATSSAGGGILALLRKGPLDGPRWRSEAVSAVSHMASESVASRCVRETPASGWVISSRWP
jgi:hypothetical protein